MISRHESSEQQQQQTFVLFPLKVLHLPEMNFFAVMDAIVKAIFQLPNHQFHLQQRYSAQYSRVLQTYPKQLLWIARLFKH